MRISRRGSPSPCHSGTGAESSRPTSRWPASIAAPTSAAAMLLPCDHESCGVLRVNPPA